MQPSRKQGRYNIRGSWIYPNQRCGDGGTADVEGWGVCEGFGFVGGERDFSGEFALPYSLEEERWKVLFFVVGGEVFFWGGEVLSYHELTMRR